MKKIVILLMMAFSLVVYGEKYYYGHMETMRKIEVIKHLKEAMEQFNQSMQQDIDIIDIIDIQ